MGKDFSICVGVVGQGMVQSPDGGETWNRIRSPFPLESLVRGITVHPQKSHVVYASADTSVYRSEDRGLNWERLGGWESLGPDMERFRAFHMTVDPVDPEILFVGTTPAALFRSRDGGRSWERLDVDMAQECLIGPTRVTTMAIDPLDNRGVWAGVELDGVFRSLDGGDSWTQVETGTTDPNINRDYPNDIHRISIWPKEDRTVLVCTPARTFASRDMGESWETFVKGAQFLPVAFCQFIVPKEGNPDVMYIGTGNGAMGDAGAIYRTEDSGQTWESLRLPVEPNSPIWNLSTHPSNPDRLVANSHYGEIFTSEDSGDSWEKLDKEFSEVRDLAWLPN